MSVTATPETTASTSEEKLVVKNWKNPIIYGVLSIIGTLLIALRAPKSTISLGISDGVSWFSAEPLNINPQIYGWVASIVMLALAGYALVTTNAGKAPGRWVAPLFWFSFASGLLIWAIGSTAKPELSLVSLLNGAVLLSIPMIFGSMGGLLCERSGIVNIAIEGQLLLGAFSAVIVGSTTDSPWAGLIAAMVGGMLVSALLALFSIKYLVDQVIVGVVVNVLVSGLTGFLYARVLEANAATLNSAPKLPAFAIPGLSEIPVLGPVLFNQNVLVYLMYIVVAVIWFALNKTRWGLRTRAVGEHPKAADTLGIKELDPLLECHPRRHRGGHRRFLLHPGLRILLQLRHDRRPGLHRPRRPHLRPLDPHRSPLRRPPLRLLPQPAVRPLHPGHQGAHRTARHAALPGHHLRGSRSGGALPRPRRSGQALHQGVGPDGRVAAPLAQQGAATAVLTLLDLSREVEADAPAADWLG